MLILYKNIRYVRFVLFTKTLIKARKKDYFSMIAIVNVSITSALIRKNGHFGGENDGGYESGFI